jgi:hypothetical protein
VNFENTVTDLLARGVPVRFRARGDSMHPTIRCGEHLRVVPVEAAEVAVGDVVLARHKRGLTAHRVVWIDGARIITRGDNCSHDDPAFTSEDLVGRVHLRKFSQTRGWVRRVLTHFSRRQQRLAAAVLVVWQSVH